MAPRQGDIQALERDLEASFLSDVQLLLLRLEVILVVPLLLQIVRVVLEQHLDLALVVQRLVLLQERVQTVNELLEHQNLHEQGQRELDALDLLLARQNVQRLGEDVLDRDRFGTVVDLADLLHVAHQLVVLQVRKDLPLAAFRIVDVQMSDRLQTVRAQLDVSS